MGTLLCPLKNGLQMMFVKERAFGDRCEMFQNHGLDRRLKRLVQLLEEYCYRFLNEQRLYTCVQIHGGRYVLIIAQVQSEFVQWFEVMLTNYNSGYLLPK